MDAAFEIVLSKAAVFGLSQCSLVAVVLWQLWSAFVQFRTSTKAWQLGRLAIKEARLLVMAPHALLANNQALVSVLLFAACGPVVRVLDCACCSVRSIVSTFGMRDAIAWSSEMCIRAACSPSCIRQLWRGMPNPAALTQAENLESSNPIYLKTRNLPLLHTAG